MKEKIIEIRNKIFNKKNKEFIMDYFEEINYFLGIIFFIALGFMISEKIGVGFISLSFFITSFLTIKRKQIAERR